MLVEYGREPRDDHFYINNSYSFQNRDFNVWGWIVEKIIMAIRDPYAIAYI